MHTHTRVRVNTSCFALQAVLRSAEEMANEAHRPMYVYQLPGGEWHGDATLPTQQPYLRIGPDGGADLLSIDKAAEREK